VNQWRATGGILLKGSRQVHIDPGPGALLRLLENNENPQKTDLLLISHAHVDHCNDANIIIEAMTRTGRSQGSFLAASKNVLSNDERFDRAITRYHEKMLDKAVALSPGEEVELGGVSVKATKTVHGDASGVGFLIKLDSKVVGYSGDTEYFPGLGKLFEGCDALVLNNLVPLGGHIPTHMSTDGAIKVAEEAKPGLLVLNHFGMAFLRAGPENQARLVEEKTGVKTVAARDGMRLQLDEKEPGKSLLDY